MISVENRRPSCWNSISIFRTWLNKLVASTEFFCNHFGVFIVANDCNYLPSDFSGPHLKPNYRDTMEKSLIRADNLLPTLVARIFLPLYRLTEGIPAMGCQSNGIVGLWLFMLSSLSASHFNVCVSIGNWPIVYTVRTGLDYLLVYSVQIAQKRFRLPVDAFAHMIAWYHSIRKANKINNCWIVSTACLYLSLYLCSCLLSTFRNKSNQNTSQFFFSYKFSLHPSLFQNYIHSQ